MVSKTIVAQVTVGSNPTPSAKQVQVNARFAVMVALGGQRLASRCKPFANTSGESASFDGVGSGVRHAIKQVLILALREGLGGVTQDG